MGSLVKFARDAQSPYPKPSLSGLWIPWSGLMALLLQLGDPLPAWCQSPAGVWSGTGQILSGHGQGATVQLVLELQQGRIRTRSGPTLDAPFAGGSATINNGEGTWQIEQQGDHYSVTFYRGDQVIRYLLRPTSPSSNGGMVQPIVNTTPYRMIAPIHEFLIPVGNP
ncbi:MAG: hypothetical protein NW237_13280 [Cyanobacteriota bacterium]|nr:hypothetical protein [Cyanobacteriota bacterium]